MIIFEYIEYMFVGNTRGLGRPWWQIFSNGLGNKLFIVILTSIIFEIVIKIQK